MNMIVMSFNDVVMHESSECRPLNMQVSKGGICLLSGEASCFFDVVQGLTSPAAGSVVFEGVEWARLPAFEECRQRSLIGRTFSAAEGWVSNLTVRQNIELRSSYHRPSSQPVCGSIDDLARTLAVSAYMDLRPEGISKEALMCCQWIRLFSYPNSIVLLDRPTDGVSAASCEVFMKLLKVSISNGCAVFWNCADENLSSLICRDKRPVRMKIANGNIDIEGECLK